MNVVAQPVVPTLVAPQPPWLPSGPPGHMPLKEWKEAQEILPNLYLGPFQASTNLGRLRSMGIAYILCLRDSMEARFIFPRYPTEFRYLTLDIADSGVQNIISIFPQCCAFIDEALASEGAILVHCNSGIATAPAIVVGYLMEKFGWEFNTALTYVQSKRYCVSPASFENQLREYYPIIASRRQLAAVHLTVPGAPAIGAASTSDRKRHRDGDEEEVSEMDGRRRRLSPRADMMDTD